MSMLFREKNTVESSVFNFSLNRKLRIPRTRGNKGDGEIHITTEILILNLYNENRFNEFGRETM